MKNKELLNECDMLKGNINRMMVTDDKKELREMYDWACKRLQTIYTERYEELADAEASADYNYNLMGLMRM